MGANKKIRVFVVDDSMLYRNFLMNNIKADERFEVVGHAVDAFDAMKQIPTINPDVITLDIEMPGMSGIDFLKELLPKHPVPVILVSTLNIRVFDALASGAVDYVKKPDFSDQDAAVSFVERLRNKIYVASFSKVRIPQHDIAETGKPMTVSQGTILKETAPSNLKVPGISSQKIVAIGASTGGTEAILSVVRNFPADMPGVVITQHMPAGFTAMYAERLNRICKMEVREAKNGDHVKQGVMLLAPGGYQMRVQKMGSGYSVSVTQEERVNGHAPSVDVLFNSVAQNVRENALGVILTGMGNDGAAGLLRMRKNGAFTIGQDKESCVVYGMPMEAYKIGAVCQQASLMNIPSIIYKKLGIIK